MTEDQQRFEEIIGNIDELIEEAINIIPENLVSKAKSYWYAHIMCAINDDHEFLGGSMHHMQDCLDEWMEQEDEDEDDYIASNRLPNEGPINDEDWDMDAGRPARMRDEDWG